MPVGKAAFPSALQRCGLKAGDWVQVCGAVYSRRLGVDQGGIAVPLTIIAESNNG